MMISRLAYIEQQRFERMGFKTVVTPTSVVVTSPLQIMQLMNDSYILTGIRASAPNLLADINEVCLISPTDSLQATEQEIATLGTTTNRMFRNYLIIKTTGAKAYSTEDKITPFRLDFIRVTPIIHKR
jgi:hypothetical protein